jgi:hypothetical protein
MRILDLKELEELLGDSVDAFFGGDMWSRWQICYRTPREAGDSTVLARELSHELNTGTGSTLVIGATGIFPSIENGYLVEVFRLAFGESRSVQRAPVHIFEATEGKACWSMICLCLYNPWDFLLLSANHNVFVRGSHDGWIGIQTRDEQNFHRLQRAMKSLGLAELPARQPARNWDDESLDKLRKRFERDPENTSAREQFAQALCEASEQADKRGQKNYGTLFAELRQLAIQYPSDPGVADAYVQAINYGLRHAAKENRSEGSQALRELEEVARRQPRFAEYAAGMQRWFRDQG